MNPNNGDILAMATYPNYNLNNPSKVSSISDSDWKKMTSEQKANEEKQNLQNQLKAAQSEKNLAESKLALFTSGCNKDFIDEALVLVNAKISDEVTFEQAIEDVKKKFPAMFESSEISGAKGTGTGVNRKNASNSNSDSLATTLAKQRVKTTQTNPYFKKG